MKTSSTQTLLCFVVLFATMIPTLATTVADCINDSFFVFKQCLTTLGSCTIFSDNCSTSCLSNNQCQYPNGCCIDGFCQTSYFCSYSTQNGAPSEENSSVTSDSIDDEAATKRRTIIAIVVPSILGILFIGVIYYCIRKQALSRRLAQIQATQAAESKQQAMQNLNMMQLQQNQMMQQQEVKQESMFQNNVMMVGNTNPSYSQQNMMMYQPQPQHQQVSFQQQGIIQNV